MPLPITRRLRGDAEPLTTTPWLIVGGRVEFRLPYDKARSRGLPDFEFDDQGRRKKRENGVWHLELWASGMVRKPDCGWWKLDSILSTMSLDFRAEVLLGNPIPQAVADHQWLAHYEKFWPRNGFPSALIGTRNEYFWRDDGEYFLEGSEYVFKRNDAPPLPILTAAPVKAKAAPVFARLRGDDDDDLFTAPAPAPTSSRRLRE